MELTQKPTESRADPFAAEEDRKIIERRLELLREGLKPLSGEEAQKKEVQKAHEAIEAGVGELPSAPPPPQAAVVQGQHYHDTKVKELKTYEADKQLKALVEIALERDLQDAVDIARRLDDAHLLDAFHDTLQDDEKLRAMLVEQGKLKEV